MGRESKKAAKCCLVIMVMMVVLICILGALTLPIPDWVMGIYGVCMFIIFALIFRSHIISNKKK